MLYRGKNFTFQRLTESELVYQSVFHLFPTKTGAVQRNLLSFENCDIVVCPNDKLIINGRIACGLSSINGLLDRSYTQEK